MTLRHAVALALVGWYLMVPPHTRSHDMPQGIDDLDVKIKAPFSQWETLGNYDSARECDNRLDDLVTQAGRFLDNIWNLDLKKKSNMDRVQSSETLIWAQCIASDDPRLKGN